MISIRDGCGESLESSEEDNDDRSQDLLTRYNDSAFRKFLLENWSKRLFITGRLADDLSIELFVDNLLDYLQWREVELLHFMLDRFVENYFCSFISDLIDTTVHEYIHYFERSVPEEQVKKMSRLIQEVMTSEEAPSVDTNLIILN